LKLHVEGQEIETGREREIFTDTQLIREYTETSGNLEIFNVLMYGLPMGQRDGASPDRTVHPYDRSVNLLLSPAYVVFQSSVSTFTADVLVSKSPYGSVISCQCEGERNV
jgi:hypothetical protein